MPPRVTCGSFDTKEFLLNCYLAGAALANLVIRDVDWTRTSPELMSLNQTPYFAVGAKASPHKDFI